MAERKAFLLRLPPGLHADLERWARDDLRSLNAQIEFLLTRAVAEHRRGRGSPPPGEEESGDASSPADPAQRPPLA